MPLIEALFHAGSEPFVVSQKTPALRHKAARSEEKRRSASSDSTRDAACGVVPEALSTSQTAPSPD